MKIRASKHSKLQFTSIFIFCLVLIAPINSFANPDDWGMVQRFNERQKLAHQGNIKAMYDIGKFYERGRGVNKNMIKAAEWFQKASNEGHAAAQARLGILYFEGRGVTKNHKKALKLLNAAAKKNVASAQFQLANMYELGASVSKNLNTAISWYKKADKNGYYLAKAKVAYLQQLLKTTRNNEKLGPSPSVAKKPTKKVTTKPEASLLKSINNGRWLKRKNPVGYLPSTITSCAKKSYNSTQCISTSQERDTGSEIVTYNTESTITAKNKSDFQVVYRNNVLEVSTYSSKDGDGVNEGVTPTRIKTGKQGKKRKLSCKFKNENLISCTKGSSQPFDLVSP